MCMPSHTHTHTPKTMCHPHTRYHHLSEIAKAVVSQPLKELAMVDYVLKEEQLAAIKSSSINCMISIIGQQIHYMLIWTRIHVSRNRNGMPTHRLLSQDVPPVPGKRDRRDSGIWSHVPHVSRHL